MLTPTRTPRFLTDSDSSVNSVRAQSRFLDGRDHPAQSLRSRSRRLIGAATSPADRVRAALYRVAGFAPGTPLHRVRSLDVDRLDEWAVRQYGDGPFPVVVIGSASGGALHLAAALRAPFLPHTTLSAVRDLATHSDDPQFAMAALAPTARLVARNNPRVSVYHRHDPAQDRPALAALAHLQLKRLRLGRPYERFLQRQLAPGGTILQVECTRQWRTRAVGERTYFQFGSLGGLSEREYHEPGDRVARYLEQEQSPVRSWHPPDMDSRRPEAEWGWDVTLSQDIGEFAAQYGHPVRRMVAGEPQDHSPFVADLYRWWYARLGYPSNQLLVESYLQWDPMWSLRTGSVPFWLRSNMDSDLAILREYLELARPYDTIYLNLFSPGIPCPGMVPVDRWEQLLTRYARDRGELIGMDRHAYPTDRKSAARYREGVRAIPSRYPLPEPLGIDDVDRFVAQAPPHYQVTWH